MAIKKNLNDFYKKALKKILSFRADELTIEEFTQVKRCAEKLEVYRFVRRKYCRKIKNYLKLDNILIHI